MVIERSHYRFSFDAKKIGRTMSEHDDTLLDEDLGDEEYDLGNDEEEALLADDYELDRQNSYKGEEETDDVLDLGVTDALDDLEGEDENVEFNRSKTDIENHFYEDGDQQDNETGFYKQEKTTDYNTDQISQYEANSGCSSVNMSATIGKGDLREKLQKNMQKVYIGNGQGLEDDDCEEAKERRNRFQNERTMISPKMNNDIPDTLENVVTPEPSKPSFRGRGRGRCTRGNKIGRFISSVSGNYSPRFSNARGFDNQQSLCRPPLLEARPPFLLGVPNNIQNQQIMYQQQNNSSIPNFQQFSLNNPLQGPTHFIESRPPFNPNQFSNSMGSRVITPRLEFGPRGNIAAPLQAPPYNCSTNPTSFVQIPPNFQNSGAIMQDNPNRHLPNTQASLLHGNSGGSLLGNPNAILSNNSSQMLHGNQSLPLQGNQILPLQGYPRPPVSNQGPLIQNPPNTQMSSGSSFENRAPFQEQHFENRSTYDSRHPYPDQIQNNQFNSNIIPPVSQQSNSNLPNVTLTPGHKILINPHFRGAVQPTNDARLAWDSQHPTPLQTQGSGVQFNQTNMPYPNQNPYNQSQSQSQSQSNQLQYQQNYQQNKSDDPYAYFSDVWQENKPQKTINISPNKQQYPLESNYSRESNYNDNSKYKSDDQWEQRDNYQQSEYRGSHVNYRERDLSSRTRNDHTHKPQRPLPSSTYRNENYEQNHMQKPSNSRPPINTARTINKLQQKRVCQISDKEAPPELSQKKMKTNNRNLQEVRTVDTVGDAVEEKKEEDKEEDPEMREYRKKMEEQKRLREQILKEKENRRKMAAMEKQNEQINKIETNFVGTECKQQEAKPVSVLLGVVKDPTPNKGRPGVTRGRGRVINTQATEGTERAPGMRIVRTIQTIQPNDPSDGLTINNQSSDKVSTIRQINPQCGTRRVVIPKSIQPSNSQKIATSIQKTVSNLQKGQGSGTNILQKLVQNQSGISRKSPIGQKMGNIDRSIAPKVVVNAQNNQRIVLQKVMVSPKKIMPEIKTNTVKLENLAASTSVAQIRRMCQGIGTIESIHMGEGNATIVFKTQSAAMVFHKKYQRKMLDLSLITVRLMPQTNINKATTAIGKKS
ncbi:PREDICTED: RNA-binding protein 33-like isoform X2 [Polistes dominula]|uniref:RNA-binding protein 33-like isoform X2 n=1 Tax=Polistes dominula TaxID=743375 RepID=A0ABM1I400_POLDO|nr:PREDICTED: RNA-binding protein 33-like isoform X2 [Polistes dominula]